MPAAFEVEDDFLFVGRTFTEYRRMFDLDTGRLSESRVLDCPGGPGSFTAVAREIGAEAVAVDPMYAAPVARLEAEAESAIERNVAQLREKRDRFVWDEYGDPGTRGRYLRAAAERFLADYANHPGRYVGGALPRLPFPDGAFDLALSGNLLFLYDDRLDRSFHRAALAELARVASEVRVFPLFPLAGLDRSRSALVDPLVEEFRAAGWSVTLHGTDYEFQPGATDVLVVRAGPDGAADGNS